MNLMLPLRGIWVDPSMLVSNFASKWAWEVEILVCPVIFNILDIDRRQSTTDILSIERLFVAKPRNLLPKDQK
jgi:hypothetical protein